MSRAALEIGGFVPFSTTDYPDRLAAVVFCQSCPWRCTYCHNPHLLAAHGEQALHWDAIARFLESRRGLLDAVVFSGGEPTAQAALPVVLRETRDMGFLVGLHTAGVYPQRLARLLPLVDWIGMDVKAPFAKYGRVTGVGASAIRARESIQHIIASGVDHTFRTTVDPRHIDENDLRAIRETMSRMGARDHVMQECRHISSDVSVNT